MWPAKRPSRQHMACHERVLLYKTAAAVLADEALLGRGLSQGTDVWQASPGSKRLWHLRPRLHPARARPGRNRQRQAPCCSPLLHDGGETGAESMLLPAMQVDGALLGHPDVAEAVSLWGA